MAPSCRPDDEDEDVQHVHTLRMFALFYATLFALIGGVSLYVARLS